MKVLHLLHGFSFGGIGSVVRSIVQAQCETSEVEPAVLYGRLSDAIFEEHLKSGATLHHVPLGGGYDISPFAAYQITKIFKQVDVLHFHFFHPMYMVCAVFSGTPIVYTFHGNFGLNRKKTIKDYVKRIILKYFIRLFVDFITFNSNFTKTLAEKLYSIRRTDSSVVYNGLNIDRIAGVPSNLPKEFLANHRDKFVVGACGRLVQTKRIDRLIDAFASFRVGKSDVALVIVGDGILRESLQHSIEAHGVEDLARIVGFQHNVFDYEAIFDVCVVPSRGEAFGLVALEALAMGKPTIVCDDGGGLIELISDLEPADIATGIDGITKRLDHYYENRGKKHEEAPRRVKYAKRFHIDITVGEFIKVYRKTRARATPKTLIMAD